MKRSSVITLTGGLLAAVGGALAAYVYTLRPWHLRWGATPEELSETLPGDELVTDVKQTATHAITIDAPAKDVWPWLVQMGQTRGGFYSYTWLENLVGCEMHNAEEIVPAWQNIKVGDQVWLHPKAPPLAVVIAEPYRALVLGNSPQEEELPVAAGTWGFYLKALDENQTRLLIRIRWEQQPGLLNWLGGYVLLEPAHFIMERKMLLEIKRRVEESVRQSAPPPVAELAASAASVAG